MYINIQYLYIYTHTQRLEKEQTKMLTLLDFPGGAD